MDSMRLLYFFAFAIVILSNGATGEYCFQNRVPRGIQGICTVLIQSGTTKAECCIAGGTGWTTKSSGKKCGETCDEISGEVIPTATPDPPAQEDETDDVRNCFRTREARGSMGTCDDLIGRTTKDQCCRYGGKGWTEKPSGKRCQDTCDGVVDVGPEGHCFSDFRQNDRRRRRCFGSLGAMTRLECCQQAGVGWTQNENGVGCEDSCEQHSVDGGWSEWSNWQICSVSCGQGVQSRSRTCDNPPPTNGGANCAGETTEQELCDEGLCPIDGRWSEWSDYQSCSVSCGEGVQSRSRTCDNPPPTNGGADCVGETTEHAFCDEGLCPVHGGWGSWGRPGSCSATCQSESSRVYREKYRLCDNPAPLRNGRYCEGSSVFRIRCKLLPFCEIHGGWSDYDPWSACSQTCETGIQIRDRRCDRPPPQHGGNNCSGETRDEKVCVSSRRCPVHGGWALWSTWTECDAKRCGVDGNRLRTRTCTDPSPRLGGLYCSGSVIERESCSICPHWSEWSVWLPCTDGCEQGSVQPRYRKCLGIGRCIGDEYMQTKSCSELDPCPIADDGSGSGSGSGSGMLDVICDDEDECMPPPGETGFSYSIDEGPSDPCDDGNFDYSLDYLKENDCGNGPVLPVDSYSADDSKDPDVPPDVPPVDEDSYSSFDDVDDAVVPPVIPPVDEDSYSSYDDVDDAPVPPGEDSYSLEDPDDAAEEPEPVAPAQDNSYSLY